MKTLIGLYDECQIKNVIAGLSFQPGKIIFVGFRQNMKNSHRKSLEKFFRMKNVDVSIEYECVSRYDYDSIVTVLSGIIDSNEDCCFEYRKSRFSDTKECILRGYFKVQKGNKEEIQAKMQDLITRRIEKQPLDKYSAGSTFKRGKDFYASATISECGLKGYAVNDAMVSTKHAGFLINEGNASYTEFLALIHDVKRIVFEKTGRVLETEVKIIE